MLTRDGAGRILRARWPPLVALAATLGYAVVVIGFGLDFRPLHNDEGVTLGVASRASALDVLRVAVDHRHGPPLHYLLVHASLALARTTSSACACRRRCSASSPWRSATASAAS